MSNLAKVWEELSRTQLYIVTEAKYMMPQEKLNALGIPKVNDSSMRSIMNQRNFYNISIPHAAKKVVEGVPFALRDPQRDAIKIYKLLLRYMKEVNITYHEFNRVVIHRSEITDLKNKMLNDAIHIEKLADSIYPIAITFGLKDEIAATKSKGLNAFKNNISASKTEDNDEIEEKLATPVEEQPHRLVFREGIPQSILDDLETELELALWT